MRMRNISFGSTYAIKYNYIRNNEAKGLNDRLYKSENDAVDEFIRKIDRDYKAKNDVSSFSPEKKLYFLNMRNKKKKDEAVESLAREFGIEIKKVNPREMKETQIVSVGRCQEGKDGELKVINNLITSYNK